MKKLKKLFRVLLVIAALMLFSSFVVENVSRNFYIAFASLYAVCAIFIIFGWDKHITYGDDINTSSQQNKYDDFEDFDND